MSDGVEVRQIAESRIEPYLRRETDIEPPRPATLSDSPAPAWRTWLSIAELVRNDPAAQDIADSDQNVMIAAELPISIGRSDLIAAHVKARGPSWTIVTIADDLSKRLDRMCASYLWHPGEALLLIGRPVFKFDEMK